MNPNSDKQLMFAVRDGELDQLGVLFERHHRRLYNFFLRLTGSAQLSEDLVQEVFLRMLKYRHTYRGDSEFLVWMFKIARNARVDSFKKKKLATADDTEPDELASRDPNPTEHMERQQSHALVHAALNRLRPEEREVLLLSRFQDIKYKEIAEILGCLEGTVKARVHRAVQRLRDVYFQLSGDQE